MKNSLLAEHLRVLRPEEVARLEVFLGSPFCNEHPHPEQQQRLVRWLYPRIGPDATQGEPIESEACSAVFGDATVPMGKLDKLMSATLQALKRFAAELQRRRDADPAAAELALAAFYRERGLAQRHERLAESIRNELNSRNFKAENWASTYFQFESEVFEMALRRGDVLGDANLGAAIRALDQSWFLHRLRLLMCFFHLKSLRPGLDSTLFHAWFEPLLPIAAQEFAVANPFLRIYLVAVQLVSLPEPEPDDATLHRLLDTLADIRDDLPPVHLLALEQFALSYLARLAYTGRNVSVPMFQIYRAQADQDRILFNGKIPATNFINIVNTGLRAGQDAWVEGFIGRFENNIGDTRQPADVHRLALARLHFARRDFEGALDLLPAVFDSILTKIFARAFELQVLYELDSPLFDARLEAFKVFVFREKQITQAKKEMYSRFADLLLQLRAPATRNSPARRAKLAEKVQRSVNIAERYWLLDKLLA